MMLNDLNANNLRIAISPTIFRVQKEGGISRYFYRLILGLLSNSFSVYHGNIAPSSKYLNMLKETTSLTNSKSEAMIGNFLLDERIPLGWAPRSLKIWKPNIIHETYFSTKWFRSISGSTKKVITVYDLIEEKMNPIQDAKFRKRAALKLTDHVICISNATRNDLIEIYDFPIERTSVVYLAPYPMAISHNLDKKQFINDGRPFFLYVGARGGYKNFKILVEAFSLFSNVEPDFHLITFGGGPFKEEELRHFSALSINSKIKNISGDDALLSIYYRSAVALIYPSLMEGFGMPPLEAMQMGTLVIVSNCAASVEILSGSSAVFFDPECKEDLFEKMGIALQSDDIVQNITKKNKIYSSNFTWDKCIAETINVYNMILN